MKFICQPCVGVFFYYIISPMRISESIEANMSTAVATISQRNQATLPGFHKIILSPIFNIFNRLAKASGFCLYFYSDFHYIASNI